MAVTQVNYTGNGSTTNYSFTFPYLDKTDVKVRIDGTIQPTTAYSFANATTIAMDSAPANGAKVVILRDTNVDSRKATFYAGSAIKSEDLNDNSDQVLYTVQEIDNNAMTTDGTTPMTGDFTLGEDLSIIFEGATDNAYETTLTVADPTADRTITLPNETGTVITSASTNVIDSDHYVDGSIDLAHMSANSVDSDQYVDGSIDLVHMSANSVDSDQYVDGSIDLVHMSANSVDSDQYVDGSIDLVHMSANSVDSDQYVDGSIDGVHIANDAIDSQHYAAGSIDLEHMSANSVDSDQYVDGSIDLAHMSANSVDSDQYVDGSIDLIHMSANSVDSDQYVDGSIDRVHLSADIIDATKIEDNAVTTDHIADAELTTLAGMQAGTASILAGGTALTSTLTELNQLDGKTLGETTLTTNSDTAIPTSKAVNDRILTVTNALGGFVAIADKDNFPTSNPDPSGGAGTVVSISNAAGISVNSSGVGSLATRAGGSDAVIINGFPSALRGGATVGSATNANPYILPSSVGLQVQTTSTAHTYDYHKYFINEEDANKLSGDIQDFQERYRVAASAPTSSKDDGDLWFDTTNNKMKVYNASGSSWDDVAAPGNFFINTISSSSGTGGGSATFNGTAYRFTLSSPPSQGAQQLIISINGVIQKPNSGTSQPAEGFAVDTNDVIFSAAPPSGSDYFIITLGNTVNIGTPSDNTVSTAKIQNGAVTGEKIATNLDLADNKKIRWGTGNDLEIYHDGSDNYIKSLIANGDLILDTAQNFYIKHSGENMLQATNDGAVNLYHNGNKKFETHQYGVDVSGNVYIGDSGEGKLLIGAGEDLQIYHDGSHSYLQNGTGTLFVRAKTTETGIAVIPDGAVELYYDNALKLSTASGGVNVAGNLNMNGADSYELRLGAGNDLKLFHNGTRSKIENLTGDLRICSNAIQIKNYDDDETYITCADDGAVELYHNNVKKLETTSTGYKGGDNVKAGFGDDGDMQIWHDATNSVIRNATGTLYLQSQSHIELTHRHSDNSEEKALFSNVNGAVELYYNGSKKFETITSGVRISSGDLELLDNTGSTGRLLLGNGSDLRLYHNGSHSYIENLTGTLYFKTPTNLSFSTNSTEDAILAMANGAVELYYDNSKKLETWSGGVTATGGVYSNETSGTSFKAEDGGKFVAGGGDDLQIYHNGNHSFLHNSTGDFVFEGDSIDFWDAAGAESLMKLQKDGSVDLYYDNSRKLHTRSDGVNVIGDLDMTDADNYKINLGIGSDLQIYHNGANSVIENLTGALVFKPEGLLRIQDRTSGEVRADFNDNSSVDLYHDGNKKFETTTAGITVTGAVTETSDIALKTNIEPIDNVLDKIQQITGYKYQFKDTGHDSMGVTAQDVEKVFPELVHGEEGTKTLQYSGLIGALIESIKELSNKVAALEAK